MIIVMIIMMVIIVNTSKQNNNTSKKSKKHNCNNGNSTINKNLTQRVRMVSSPALVISASLDQGEWLAAVHSSQSATGASAHFLACPTDPQGTASAEGLKSMITCRCLLCLRCSG